MLAPALAFRSVTTLTLLLPFILLISGCDAYLDKQYQKTLVPTQGQQPLVGLFDAVSVRRNALGVPLIEGRNFHDAVFALGYVHASDRLSQMVGLRLTAQGRLSELVGAGVLDIDRFMRTVNLRQSAENLYRSASPQIKHLLDVYARGVNAYIYRYRDQYPLDLAGQEPEYWTPQDSALIFCLINFSFSVNLQEELAALSMAQKVGVDRLAWLLPVYPDEPLPFEEANKLKGLDLRAVAQPWSAEGVKAVTDVLSQIMPFGMAASNNWVVSGLKTQSGKPLLANDTHLPLSIPSYWTLVQVQAPEFQGAGVSIAGIPAIVAGFNGRLAWGITMVMGDNQDLFLEQLRYDQGRLSYLVQDQWVPAQERYETYRIKGQSAVREAVYETRHGPLLNTALGPQRNPVQPVPVSLAYGIALKQRSFEGDQSLEGFFKLSQAASVSKGILATEQIESSPLNIVMADQKSIAWQVTGRYPNRKEGVGLIPSPGWTGRYDWDGFAEPMLLPNDRDPSQGWLGTANHRTVARGYGMQLSSSWHYPDRFERLTELMSQGKQDLRSTVAMQYDQTSVFAAKLKAMLQGPGMEQPLAQSVQALPAERRAKAQEALRSLLAFDGRLDSESLGAAVYEAFLYEAARQIFLDELGPETQVAWQALVQTASTSYSAQADHLLAREDSPFWDDIATPQVETKPDILARALASAIELLEQRLGKDRHQWQWGALHRYHWVSGPSQLAASMNLSQRLATEAIAGYLNRGPYPAGGDFSTLNVSGNRWGSSFDVWLIPAMRLIVDFGQEEPMMALNSSGQSGNPASPHYADGIEAWLKAQYMSFPFKAENQNKVYGNERLMLVPEQAKP